MVKSSRGPRCRPGCRCTRTSPEAGQEARAGGRARRRDAASPRDPPDPFHRGRVQDHGRGRHRGAPLPRCGGHQSCPIIHYYGYRRYLKHEGYDIPYRALVPQKVENLLVTGRCISSEQQPYESHRAMVPMMAIGQGSGVAAALCARTGASPRTLDVALLQQTLIAQGAELRLP